MGAKGATTEAGAGVTERVDQVRPIRSLVPFAVQHILVMIATPISSVFLIGRSLDLSTQVTSTILASVFIFSGLGSILQSVGVWRIGVRLPFVMLPGGAAVVLFISVAKGSDPQTAAGAVLLTGIFYILVVTLFVRVLKYFPPLVIGTMVVVIGINLVQVTGQLITGDPESQNFGDTKDLLLALITIGLTVAFFRFFRGVWRQLAVAFGLAAGTVVAALMGLTDFSGHTAGPAVAVPKLFPFGVPHLDLVAAVPMLVWSLASMAEATGQTVINGEIVGRKVHPPPGRASCRSCRWNRVACRWLVRHARDGHERGKHRYRAGKRCSKPLCYGDCGSPPHCDRL